jgi:hypothetical protein
MAWELAQEIWEKYQVPSEVFITSQSDSPISEPWSVIVNSTADLDKKGVQDLIDLMLENSGDFTDRLIAGSFPLV